MELVNAEKPAEGQVMDQSLNFILRLNEKPLKGFKNDHDLVCVGFNNIILMALWNNRVGGQNGNSSLEEREGTYHREVERKALIGTYFESRWLPWYLSW